MNSRRANNFDDKTGKTYGQLVVLSLKEIKKSVSGKKKAIWLCQCSCGKMIPVISGNLSSGNTTNCGHTRVERLQKYVDNILRLPIGEAAFNAVYAKYKQSATRRALAFDLTKEEVRRLCLGDCSYCGALPNNVETDYGRRNGKFVYNGIDRENNDVGYVVGNCVSCCWTCNFMKRTMGKIAFLNHISAIYHKSIGDKSV
jgi:hypothetical protein